MMSLPAWAAALTALGGVLLSAAMLSSTSRRFFAVCMVMLALSAFVAAGVLTLVVA
jgi:hypothetical protein